LGELPFKASLDKKFSRTHLNRKSWTWWGMPVIPVIAGSISRKMAVQDFPGRK
jgi:hypothetical protein